MSTTEIKNAKNKWQQLFDLLQESYKLAEELNASNELLNALNNGILESNSEVAGYEDALTDRI